MSRIARHLPDDPQAWAQPLRFAPQPRRRCCSHAESLHYRDRKGRPTCASAACGCIEFRSAS